MAGVSYQLDYDFNDALKGFDELIQRVDNLEPALREIGEAMLFSTEERFAQQVSPSGEPWQPLSPKYRARKKRNPYRILLLDGYLAQINYQVNGDSLEWGSNKIYAATHQFGDDARNIPAREFLRIDQDDGETIEGILGRYLANFD